MEIKSNPNGKLRIGKEYQKIVAVKSQDINRRIGKGWTWNWDYDWKRNQEGRWNSNMIEEGYWYGD